MPTINLPLWARLLLLAVILAIAAINHSGLLAAGSVGAHVLAALGEFVAGLAVLFGARAVPTAVAPAEPPITRDDPPPPRPPLPISRVAVLLAAGLALGASACTPAQLAFLEATGRRTLVDLAGPLVRALVSLFGLLDDPAVAPQDVAAQLAQRHGARAAQGAVEVAYHEGAAQAMQACPRARMMADAGPVGYRVDPAAPAAGGNYRFDPAVATPEVLSQLRALRASRLGELHAAPPGWFAPRRDAPARP